VIKNKRRGSPRRPFFTKKLAASYAKWLMRPDGPMSDNLMAGLRLLRLDLPLSGYVVTHERGPNE
jgi:hypothetical protein